jgi:hypothetical protein
MSELGIDSAGDLPNDLPSDSLSDSPSANLHQSQETRSGAELFAAAMEAAGELFKESMREAAHPT